MEDKMGEMLRTSMFGSRQQQQALKEKLRSEPCELTEEELENVAGGVYTEDYGIPDDLFFGMVPR
jgi:bacteriocin-like protein